MVEAMDPQIGGRAAPRLVGLRLLPFGFVEGAARRFPFHVLMACFGRARRAAASFFLSSPSFSSLPITHAIAWTQVFHTFEATRSAAAASGARGQQQQ